MTGFFKYTINDDIWCFYVVKDDDEVVAGEDSAAEVDFESKEAYFRENEINITNVRHELWHVYCGYLFLHAATIDQHNFEEITAELFAHKGTVIINKSDDILKRLQKVKKNGTDGEDKDE